MKPQRPARVLVLVALLLAVGAVGVSADVLAPNIAAPLPGSTFEGANGDETPTGGLTDWQTLESEHRVHVIDDTQNPDTIFKQGSAEDEPNLWDFGTQNNGASPGSADILNVYSATGVSRASAGHPRATFLYLAFTREANTGTVALVLELNQDHTLWQNAAGSMVPCRKTGDILITFSQNGTTVAVNVDRWVTDTANANGCAETGHLDPASGLTPQVDVQGSFNDSNITNYLPGVAGGYAVGDTLAPRIFAEAAINLTKWAASIQRRCGFVGSVWAHSRASDQITSEMKDYVAPSHVRVPVAGCPLLATKAAGSGTRLRGARPRVPVGSPLFDRALLIRGAHPTGGITFGLYGPSDPTCSGPPLFTTATAVNGNGVYRSQSAPRNATTVPGTYRWRARYSGDGNNQPSRATACGDPLETVILTAQATPQLTTTASQAVTLGRSIHDVAHLSAGDHPTGNISFRLYGPGDTTCGTPIFTAPSVPVLGNRDYRSASYVPTVAGIYRWRAGYSGDPNNATAGPTACNDLGEGVVVRPASIVPVVPRFSSTASSSPALGAPISDTAHLAGGRAATGTISFSLYGPGDTSCTAAPVFTSTVRVIGNGNYTSASYIVPQPGTYRWMDTYSGNVANAGGTDTCGETSEIAVVSSATTDNPDLGPSGPESVPPSEEPTAPSPGQPNPGHPTTKPKPTKPKPKPTTNPTAGGTHQGTAKPKHKPKPKHFAPPPPLVTG